MPHRRIRLSRRVSAILPCISLSLFLAACGGGGGSGSASAVTSQQADASDSGQDARSLSYQDVRPILDAKCIGCHNAGDNPLAPFSLEGQGTAQSFRSAIHHSLETFGMPPAGALQLTDSERAKLLAWSSGQPYDGSAATVRIALVQPGAWDVQPRNRDAFLDHRPQEIDCQRDRGWFIEDGALEVRTEFCNYASLGQQALLDLDSGTELELNFSHSRLNYNAPSVAHVALSIGGVPVWEKTIDIPAESALFADRVSLPVAVRRGDLIELHIHNHGANAWTLHSLEALVEEDAELDICPSFDDTFEAIQVTVFERAGCANSLCHGDAAEGGLDLRPQFAYDNLVGVRAQGSSLNLVAPGQSSLSYLYHKLSAKTFPGSYPIDGAPMPSAGEGISPGQLEAIRLWIEAGAPREGSIGDTTGQGEDALENLLGVCLPEPEAINVVPLPAPAPDRGVQFAMPPHDVPAETETEICFAVYEDFRDRIPPEYMTPDREFFYIERIETREDPFTHHNVLFYSPVPVDQLHDPAFGDWTCIDGEFAGELCEPTDPDACGAGQCRAKIGGNLACRGYGPTPPPIDTLDLPRGDGLIGGGIYPIVPGIIREGFYEVYPTHGLFYWNSHAFNLTTQDGYHHVWKNALFADDRRFRSERMNHVVHLTAGAGTPPFEKKTVCRDFVFDQGDGLLSLTSHTHKRGEHFFINLDGEQIYETFSYDEPAEIHYDPPIVFNSPDPAERTIEYCATFNNGVNADGSPNIDTVTRASLRPPNAPPCEPVACVAGKLGAPCGGRDDNAACDSSPGAGDGWCDACPIGAGVSSDDEMFVLRGARMADYDATINAVGEGITRVRVVQPQHAQGFSPGDTVRLQLHFVNFELVAPEGHHGHDGHGDDSHMSHGSDHGSVTSGHYHVYLDTEDDEADHLTAWATFSDFQLPADIAPGEHELRVSLRAPDHHAIGVEARVTIVIE